VAVLSWPKLIVFPSTQTVEREVKMMSSAKDFIDVNQFESASSGLGSGFETLIQHLQVLDPDPTPPDSRSGSRTPRSEFGTLRSGAGSSISGSRTSRYRSGTSRSGFET
jgi:hypothetical protein